MKKLCFLMISIVIGLMVYAKNDEVVIPSDAIRIRIIANSNNLEDIYAKQKLKNEIKSNLYSLVAKAQDSQEASSIIRNNLDSIHNYISAKTSDFTMNYGMNYFPQKTYKGVVYQAGNYNSLVITLGEGLGDNWWCVLYPPLCLLEDNLNTSDVEFRSYVLDILNR